MSDITLITPPDVLFNSALSILLIHPGDLIKNALNEILSRTNAPVNLFYYDLMQDHEIGWLIARVKSCDIVILDLDNCERLTSEFASYIIAQPNTFYLTANNTTPYNILSNNRIYDLSWLENIINRGNNEQTSK